LLAWPPWHSGGALEIIQVKIYGSPEKSLMVSTNLTTEFSDKTDPNMYDSGFTYLIHIEISQNSKPVMDTTHDIGWEGIMAMPINMRPFRWQFFFEQWGLYPGNYTAKTFLYFLNFKTGDTSKYLPWGDTEIEVPAPAKILYRSNTAQIIKVFPNPFSGDIRFTGPVKGVKFYTVTGRLVPVIRLAPAGQYVVRFKTAIGWKTELAIKSVF